MKVTNDLNQVGGLSVQGAGAAPQPALSASPMEAPTISPPAEQTKSGFGRVLIVSNRLPITIQSARQNEISVTLSTGGLATGLRGIHNASNGLWIGWPGDVPQEDPGVKAQIETELARVRAVPVYLTPEEITQYYEGFSNGVLWPLFHYLLDKVRLDAYRDWDMYHMVNQRFADAVVAQYQPGDLIWIHDYQLALVPGLIRKRLPQATIGFFLHIPFPSSEVFRILPWREAIIQGLLGADLIGFHTHSYLRHFNISLRHILGLEPDGAQLRTQGRTVHFGVFPMGIDASYFEAQTESPEVKALADHVRRVSAEHKLLLAIDRLDYTKGIPRRLLAIERLLETSPELRHSIRFIQVTVPSRENVDSYAQLRQQVDEMVGHINSAYAQIESVPIHHINRTLTPTELSALYQVADVMLVTPLRDGMNLVAKEFIASRTDEDGVLILSEFAGAAAELSESLLVNPYNVDQLTQTIRHALNMPKFSRHNRMKALRQRVLTSDVNRWAQNYLKKLAQISARAVEGPVVEKPSALVDELIQQVRNAQHLILLLDYDGTLVPFTSSPQLAIPDTSVLELLTQLAARPNTEVHLVSGRAHTTLAAWFGQLPIGLHAEHGLWSRVNPDREWERMAEIDMSWAASIRPILEQFTERTPGSLLEEKSASLVWHYRMTDPYFGLLQVHELRLILAETTRHLPVEIHLGNKVIEIRPKGVSKRNIAQRLQAGATESTLIVAIGDDRTDEDMFQGIPPDGITIKVGFDPTNARYRLETPYTVCQFLTNIIAD